MFNRAEKIVIFLTVLLVVVLSFLEITRPTAYNPMEDVVGIVEEQAHGFLSSRISSGEVLRQQELTLSIQRGETINDLLLNEDIQPTHVQGAIKALKKVFNIRALKAGQEIYVTIGPKNDDGYELLSINFAPSIKEIIDIIKNTDETFTAKKTQKQLKREVKLVSGSIRSSLYNDAYKNGVPPTVIHQLIEAFSYDVDFQRDIKKDDHFEILMEHYMDPDSNYSERGAFLYAKLITKGREVILYQFADSDKKLSYYKPNGESIRKSLLVTPIDGAKISSGFGMRMHPIRGYSAMHRGCDFAAPAGTRIKAAGDGVVEMASWHNGGYGNLVRIRHNGTFSTAYAHLSRFAPKIKSGSRVKQGEIIGYVGTTGNSTGPHLHFELLANGKQINPTTVRQMRGGLLGGAQMRSFQTTKAQIDKDIRSLRDNIKN